MKKKEFIDLYAQKGEFQSEAQLKERLTHF